MPATARGAIALTFTTLLGCVLAPAVARAQATTVVKPEFLLIVDTSGSMVATTMPPGGGTTNSCGYTATRQNDAACTVRNIADGIGDAIFGMATFGLNCTNATTPHYDVTGLNSGCGVTSCNYAWPAAIPATGNPGSNAGFPYPFYGCSDGAKLWVTPLDTQLNLLRSWGDFSFSSCTTAPAPGSVGGPELGNAAGVYMGNNRDTPLAGSLNGIARYLRNLNAPAQQSPYINFNGTGARDPYPSCRPLSVILLTDGDECCDASPSVDCSASSTPTGAAINARNIGCLQVDLNGDGVISNPVTSGAFAGVNEGNVDRNNDGDCYDANEQIAFKTRVYAIGFGTACGANTIETIAQAGGVPAHPVNCGGVVTNKYGYYATNEAEISTAINDIVSQSALREKCNGLDDNCNGLTDEGYNVGASCTAGVGACARTGAFACNAAGDDVVCSATPGAPGTETSSAACSDGVDNDCDGRADCADPGCFSQTFCSGGCVPQPEVCDGRDNDCDGMVDEGGITRPCGSSVGICTVGTQTCQPQSGTGTGAAIWGACSGVQPMASESCNGRDDNCNGVTDEGLTQACGMNVGDCRAGVQQCINGAYSGACIGQVTGSGEVCDGRDNDCDGMTDEGVPSGGPCGSSGVGVCSAGTIQCMNGALQCVGGVRPGAETCNNLDDDCNGLTDDGLPSAACTAPGTPSPAVGACKTGATACIGGAMVCNGAVGPTAETCNGQDDDCNGLTDDGVPSGMPCTAPGGCGTGTTACVGGRQVCMGVTSATPEVCDGVDNDCDGDTDEGNPGGGAACGMTRGECVAGTTHCVNGALICEGAVMPGAEVCNGLDDNCNGATDEGVPEGADCGSDVGECRKGHTLCVNGQVVCDGEHGPRPEECNCKDDDCNGMTDDQGTGSGSSPLCAGDSVCAGSPSCGCLRPCTDSEFPCPTGRTCQDIDGRRLCVGDPCAGITCDSSSQTCVNGVCVSRCQGVTCGGGRVCNPRNGDCTVNDCRMLQNCTAGQLCRNGSCVPDPCEGVTCDAGMACYEGTCAPSCADVMCAAGQICDRGVCHDGGACAGVTCTGRTYCDPASGTCVASQCDPNHACPVGQVCEASTGDCIDDPCAVVRCPSGQSCAAGQCSAPTRPPGAEADRVFASGGTSTSCSVGATPGNADATSPRGVLAVALGALGLVVARRRRR